MADSKLLDVQTLLLINGPSGAGKSTVSKAIWKKLTRCVLLNLDEIKWMISDYSSSDLSLASTVGVDMVKRFLESGFSVIVEKAFCKEEYIKPFIELGRSVGVRVVVVNIEAPKEVVASRANGRGVVNHLHGKEIDPTKVLRIYDNYVKHKFEVDATFNSSSLNVDETCEKLLLLLSL